jgi:glycosyltransferase involved in cell wall biosynthesis
MGNEQKTSPTVSVVMPVYNAETYLKQAVNSILEQDFEDFELIAINDGSKDKSAEILDHFSSIDSRVIVIHQKNQGLVPTLNTGITNARGRYIARMDADDVSFPSRFRHQVAALDSNASVVLVAGGFEIIDEDDDFLYREVLPCVSADIKRSMLLRNPIAHGSAMFRADACQQAGMYSNDYGPTEDFEMWVRLSQLGDFAAVESCVYRWRVNRKGITSTKNKQQLDIMRRHIDDLWQKGAPEILPTAELRRRGAYYWKNYEKRGIAMKNIMLADNAQIAVKLIRRKRYWDGFRQMMAVAFVGRAGVRAVKHRFHNIAMGTSQAIRRYAKYGRQET